MIADERKLELLKLEYDKAADRYQEIYRSMWTIFSYLSAVSAGILAVGFDKVDSSALFAISAIPLIFWFTTTYLPLDGYGNKVLDRLSKMETAAETLFQFPMCHFKDVSKIKTTDKIIYAVINIFKQEKDKGKRLCLLWRQFCRARFMIWVWFWLLLGSTAYHWYDFKTSGREFLLKNEQAERPMIFNALP